VKISADVIALGVINGLTYAMIAMGIVLIYRASRFVNFAQAQIGAVAVVIMAKLVLDYDFPYWAGVIVALLVGLASGALIELTIVRRLFNATRLVLMMATIGAAQVLLSLTQIPELQPDALTLTRKGFPLPDFPWNIRIGLYLLRDSDYLILIVVPVVTLALAAFLRWTAYGRAIRAASDNADLARLSGISVKRMSTLVWLVAALLSTIGGILLAPRNFVGIGSLGGVGLSFGVLVRAFGAALFGRMTSLVQAFVAAVAIGIIESVALASFRSSSDTELVVFLVVLAALLVRARDLGRASRGGGEARLAEEGRDLPREIARLSSVRRLRYGTLAACAVVAVAAPFLPILNLDTQSSALGLCIVAAYAIAGLSVCLLTGWGGQVSLGQFALVGVGAFVTARLVGDSVPMPIVFVAAGIVGAAIAVVIGIPALRIQGLYLALTTLSFSVLATVWLFTNETFVEEPTGSFVERPDWLRGNRAMYYFSLAILVIAILAVRRYRRAGPGRLLIAVRDNDRAARSWGISATRSRVLGFLFSGFMAAIGGVVFAYSQQRFDAQNFPAAASVNVLALAIVGGLASVSGAVLGAIFIVGPTVLFDPSPVRNLLISGLGLLLFLMYVPGGMMSVVHSARDALAQRLARRQLKLPPPPRLVPPIRQLIAAARGRPVDTAAIADAEQVTQLGRFGMTIVQDAARRAETARPAARPAPPALAGERAAPAPDPGVPALETASITLNFGGLRALDDVSITVGPTETVGLIGANGAGKTTFLDCISGYHRPRHGRIVVFGRDISSMSPTRRALAGVGRSYQDARLFPGLTVEETLLVAFEPHHRTHVAAAMLGLPGARHRERAKREQVAELIEGAGLVPFRDKYIGELSTGTRRVVDIVSILAQRPRLLLLDEPASGIAQAETEALAPLLRRMQATIGCAILVIEHDMPLIASLCDRLYALEAGKVIAEGEPDSVLHDDAVVASYLGGSNAAIERSGARSTVASTTGPTEGGRP
jgi:ABC-type branched-subunit amino acid transport system ATPase component/ABC-type branched-subunit amino acid transport system permease subunit